MSGCNGPPTGKDAPGTVASRVSAESGPDSGAQLAEIKLAVAEALDFGTAVAASGNTMVSTAPRTTVNGNTYAGTASVFVRDAATDRWTEQRRLLPHDSAASEQFGLTASVDGDTVAVGAPNASVDGVLQQGAVYLFQRNQDGPDQWGEVIKLSDSGVGTIGHFGASIAIRDDLLAIGATMPPYGGRVIIFERDRGGPNAWGKVATIGDVADGGSNEAFGSALSLDGDSLLVGAAMADVSYYNDNDGAAYLFNRDSVDRDRWNYVARLAAAEALACTGGATLADLATGSADALLEAQRCSRADSHSANDHFGTAVAVNGDTAVVGANAAEDDTGKLYSVGAAYVFQRNPAAPTQWSQVAKLSASDAGQFAYFGDSVALAGNRLLVGAHGTTVASKRSQGAAYVFERDPTSGVWRESQRITASDGLGNDRFGGAVALRDDAMLVGAPGQLGGQGAVYVYDSPPPDPAPPVACQPLVPVTDTLGDGVVLTSTAGLMLESSAGALPEPLPVWIREVGLPPEPLWSGAVSVGAPFEIGTGCTTYAPPGQPFVVGLPVPDGVDTTRLGAAFLAPASTRLDSQSTDRVWLPTDGIYDPARHLYLVTTAAVLAEGSTFLLIDDAEAAVPVQAGATSLNVVDPGSLPSAEGDGGASPLPANDSGLPPTSRFVGVCRGLSATVCQPIATQFLKSLDAAYDRYQRHGFPEPNLKYVDAQVWGTVGVYNVVYFLPSTDGRCKNGTRGFYEAASQTIFACLDPVLGLPAGLPADTFEFVAAHELFHAVQYAYENVRSKNRDDWVIEGMATAAAQSDALMARNDTLYNPRVVDVPLVEPAYPGGVNVYCAQDFWVYLFLADRIFPPGPRNFPLGELASFLERGASTATVADRLENPSNFEFMGLGDEYWGWVKNQVMEKRITFDNKLKNPCQMEESLFENSIKIEYPALSKANLDFQGDLQAKHVQITFTSDAANVTISAQVGSDFAYKIYLEDEDLCKTALPGDRIPDSQDRTFPLIKKGRVAHVLLANKAHQGSTALPPLAIVSVTVPN